MQINGSLLFREHVEITPDRAAFIFDVDGVDTCVGYAEFYRAVNRVASGLSRLGCEPGSRVLVSIQPGPALLQAIFGTVRAGLVAVLCDPNRSKASAQTFLDDAGCAAAIVDGAGTSVDEAVAASTALRHRFTVSGSWGRSFAELFDADEVELPEHVPAQHPAIAFTTSGSTGRPKLIIKTHEHFHLLGRYRSGAYTASVPDPEETTTRYLVATSLYHTGGLNAGVILGLLRGWTGVVANAFHPARILHKLADHRCSTVLFTPSQAAVLLKERDLLRELDLGALRSIRVASGPSAPEMLHRLRQAVPGTEVLNVYALTECAPCLGQPPGEQQQPDSCGRPWMGVQARILNEAGRESTQGELWLKSDLISEGTILDAVTMRERYVDGWLRTRDIFRVDAAGWLYFVGRIDDMFVCGGENVFPTEVEHILAGHPDVVDVCVVGVDDPLLGAVPGAEVVLRPGATITVADVAEYARAHAPVQHVPHRISLVSAIPTLGPGKVDRRKVRAELETDAVAVPLPPDEILQRQIGDIWQQVMNAESVDLESSFLDAGGTSLHAVELTTRLASLGIPVDIGDLLVTGNVRQLLEDAVVARGRA